MKRILTIATVILLIGSPSGFGQGLSGITAAFVDVGIGARPLALGGAYSAMVEDVNAIFWNPAGLAELQGRAVEFSYVNQFGLVPYSAFAGAISVAQIHTFGLGILASGDEQLHETTAILTYALRAEEILPELFSGLQVGVNLKYQLANYGQKGFDPSAYPLFSEQDIAAGQTAFVKGTASGFGLDLGLSFRLNNRLHLGVVTRNLISKISWENGQQAYNEGIPPRLIFGLAYFARRGLLVTADYDNSLNSDSPNRFRFGSEKVLFKLLALRGGIGQTLAAESMREYSLGMGLFRQFSNLGRLTIDYTFQIQPLANSHRFSVGMRF